MVPGQEEHCQGTRTVEAAQGAAEGSEPTCVLIRVAGHGASVAGITGISGETGPGQDEPVSGPSSGSVGHEAAAPGRVHEGGVVIPLYERWTYRHEFLTRGQRRERRWRSTFEPSGIY